MTTSTLIEVVRVDELRAALAPRRAEGARIGFVPTMGALHDGHAALLRAARESCDVVVASCYVNPTQFAAGEDFDRYPRTPESDARVVADAGADVLWRPRDRDVYGTGIDRTTIHVGAAGDVLEGAARPGHFDGVATVVARLLGATAPDLIFLGRKDYQQLVVLRQLVADLLLPVEVRAVETVRDPDGLAMSSRNAYLDRSGRRAALAIPRALGSIGGAVAGGERSAVRLRRIGREVLDAGPGIVADYVELVADGTLDAVDELAAGDAVVALVAARVGTTRLIDNARFVAPRRGGAT